MRTNIQQRDRMNDKARLFFALWPAPGLQKVLHAIGVQCRDLYGGKVMDAHTLHLTLLFLGDIERGRIPDVLEAMEAFEWPTFSFQLGQVACWRHNRILYAAPSHGAAALGQLAGVLRQKMASCGIGFDERAFTPHVTLLRKIARSCETGRMSPLEWPVTSFSLVESDNGYHNLGTWRCEQ